mgnify:CR=1 FL=1
MKHWKREIIECGAIVGFATLAWWWVSLEWKKPPLKTSLGLFNVLGDADSAYRFGEEKYLGEFARAHYLEVQK